MIDKLSANTVERLSLYRRILQNFNLDERPYIHSHQLAHLLKINPAHVRRDLMLIGFTGDIHKGYSVKGLIESVGKAIDCTHVQKVAFVGIGDLGRAVADYFNAKDSRLEIAATFRVGEEPSIQFQDVKCYHVSRMKEVLKKQKIELCVLATPASITEETAKAIISAGVKGILNFTSVRFRVPKGVYVENYDMITKLEKLAYFTNKDSCGKE